MVAVRLKQSSLRGGKVEELRDQTGDTGFLRDCAVSIGLEAVI
jgi:hypothetical protein